MPRELKLTMLSLSQLASILNVSCSFFLYIDFLFIYSIDLSFYIFPQFSFPFIPSPELLLLLHLSPSITCPTSLCFPADEKLTTEFGLAGQTSQMTCFYERDDNDQQPQSMQFLTGDASTKVNPWNAVSGARFSSSALVKINSVWQSILTITETTVADEKDYICRYVQFAMCIQCVPYILWVGWVWSPPFSLQQLLLGC